MIGPGKYDYVCDLARTLTKSDGAIVIILNGVMGTGFSAHIPDGYVLGIPNALRHVADQIEQGATELKLRVDKN